jgi:hypothetical protein
MSLASIKQVRLSPVTVACTSAPAAINRFTIPAAAAGSRTMQTATCTGCIPSVERVLSAASNGSASKLSAAAKVWWSAGKIQTHQCSVQRKTKPNSVKASHSSMKNITQNRMAAEGAQWRVTLVAVAGGQGHAAITEQLLRTNSTHSCPTCRSLNFAIKPHPAACSPYTHQLLHAQMRQHQ